MAFLWALVYVVIGVVAAALHWAKKRYIDKTTRGTLLGCIKYKPQSTYNVISAVLVSEVSLAAGHIGPELTLEQFVAAFGAGYMADSVLNKSQSAE